MATCRCTTRKLSESFERTQGAHFFTALLARTQPIEEAFSKIKHFVRKQKPRTPEELYHAIKPDINGYTDACHDNTVVMPLIDMHGEDFQKNGCAVWTYYDAITSLPARINPEYMRPSSGFG